MRARRMILPVSVGVALVAVPAVPKLAASVSDPTPVTVQADEGTDDGADHVANIKWTPGKIGGRRPA
jgi:hypothetical protein